MRTITITFGDGTVLNAMSVNKSQEHFQSANRQTVEFTFDKDAVTFEELQRLFKGSLAADFTVHDLTTETDEETGEETIISDSTTEYIDFILLARLIYHNDRVPVDPEPEPTPSNDGEDPEPTPVPTKLGALYTVKMAQLSTLEKMQRKQTEMVQDNLDAILELAEIMG